jgi:hypothetical protein
MAQWHLPHINTRISLKTLACSMALKFVLSMAMNAVTALRFIGACTP